MSNPSAAVAASLAQARAAAIQNACVLNGVTPANAAQHLLHAEEDPSGSRYYINGRLVLTIDPVAVEERTNGKTFVLRYVLKPLEND
jgi:hypothetical protein